MKTGALILDSIESRVSSLDDDPRWRLVQRIIASRQFSRAPLLSKFLVHICLETLEDRQENISEYQIGVQVFDRPVGYKTVEDNIVRNYARQLRKRLAEYFATEGQLEEIQIEVPVGGYVPVFQSRELISVPNQKPSALPTLLLRTTPGNDARSPWFEWLTSLRRWPRSLTFFLAYSLVLIAITFVLGGRFRKRPTPVPSPSYAMWTMLFQPMSSTYIVPADSGFNILQDLSHTQVNLAGYLKGDYLALPLPSMNEHSSTDLRNQQFTSFVDVQIISMLSHLPEADPQRILLRFPRDIRMDDLKSSNVILIGSITSNPWAEVAQQSLNFRILSNTEMQSAWIANNKPLPGEAGSYVSHWNEPAHDTYALIAFLPNLSGKGHMLLIQGLDVAGTQAAAETLFRGDTIAPILRRALLPDGSMRPFEILLQAKSIQSNAANTQVISSRIY